MNDINQPVKGTMEITTREQLIEWFVNLNYIDQLSLYEGRNKVGVDKGFFEESSKEFDAGWTLP